MPNSIRGENVEFTLFLDGIPYITEDVMSWDETDNSEFVEKRPCGTTKTETDIVNGNFTVNITVEKTGSYSTAKSRIIRAASEAGLSSPKWDLMITKRSREGTAIEAITYNNSVLMVKATSGSDGKSAVTETIEFRAEGRRITGDIPPAIT